MERSDDPGKRDIQVNGRIPKRRNLWLSLVSQIRRAAVSIPSNIAEGAARNSNKEFIQFLYISLGSLAELETQLLLSKELGFLKNDEIHGSIVRIRKKDVARADKVLKRQKWVMGDG